VLDAVARRQLQTQRSSSNLDMPVMTTTPSMSQDTNNVPKDDKDEKATKDNVAKTSGVAKISNSVIMAPRGKSVGDIQTSTADIVEASKPLITNPPLHKNTGDVKDTSTTKVATDASKIPPRSQMSPISHKRSMVGDIQSSLSSDSYLDKTTIERSKIFGAGVGVRAVTPPIPYKSTSSMDAGDIKSARSSDSCVSATSIESKIGAGGVRITSSPVPANYTPPLPYQPNRATSPILRTTSPTAMDGSKIARAAAAPPLPYQPRANSPVIVAPPVPYQSRANSPVQRTKSPTNMMDGPPSI
jgi:hypothetical protein